MRATAWLMVCVLSLCGCPGEVTDPALARAAAAAAKVEGRSVPELIELLKVEDPHGSTSFMAKAELAERGPSAVPTLLAGLQHEHRSVRAGCAEALGAMRPQRPVEAAPALVALLSDPGSGARVAAAWSLGELGVNDDATVAALESASGGDDGQLAIAAREALEKLRGQRPRSNP